MERKRNPTFVPTMQSIANQRIKEQQRFARGCAGKKTPGAPMKWHAWQNEDPHTRMG
jgi:hypothetical protein